MSHNSSGQVDVLVNNLVHLSQCLASEVRREIDEAAALKQHIITQEQQLLTPEDVEGIIQKVETFFHGKISEYTKLLDDEAKVIASLRKKLSEYADRNQFLEQRCKELENGLTVDVGVVQSLQDQIRQEKRFRLIAEEQAQEIVARQEYTITMLENKIKQLTTQGASINTNNNGRVTPNGIRSPGLRATFSNTVTTTPRQQPYERRRLSEESFSDILVPPNSTTPTTSYTPALPAPVTPPQEDNKPPTSTKYTALSSFLADVQSELDEITKSEGVRGDTLQSSSRVQAQQSQQQQVQTYTSNTPQQRTTPPYVPKLRIPQQ